MLLIPLSRPRFRAWPYQYSVALVDRGRGLGWRALFRRWHVLRSALLRLIDLILELGENRGRGTGRQSRRRRPSSSRSTVVGPSTRRPSSRSACATQLRIACADGSNSFASCSGTSPYQLDHLPT